MEWVDKISRYSRDESIKMNSPVLNVDFWQTNPVEKIRLKTIILKVGVLQRFYYKYVLSACMYVIQDFLF